MMRKNVLYNPFLQSLGIFGVIVAVAFAGVWSYQNLRTTQFRDQDTGAGFKYSTHLAGVKTTDASDVSAKIIFRANNSDEEKNLIRVTLQYEDNLARVSNTLHRDLLDVLVENSEKAFDQEFIKYKRVSERQYTLHGHRAAEIVFTYLSPYGQFLTQRFMIIIRDENTAFYLSAQTEKNGFDSMNKKYFNTIFNSFDFK